MSNQNYIMEMLESKDNNVTFKENFYYKARSRVQFIIIDMYSSYVSLIKKCFPMLILLLINFI